MDEAHAIWDTIPGAQVKNLFIKDAGKQYWLVVVPGDPRMDTKARRGALPLDPTKGEAFGIQ